MAQLGLDEIVGKHGVEHGTSQLDAVARQYLEVVFDVLSDFQNLLVFVERTENVDHLLGLVTIFGNGDVVGFVFLHRKA